MSNRLAGLVVRFSHHTYPPPPPPPPPPVANFTASPLTGSAPLTVTFTDTSTGGPVSWAWTFGDGGTSTQQSPSHTYTDAGTYSVVLQVSNGGGISSKTQTNYIVALPVLHLPTFTPDGSGSSNTSVTIACADSGAHLFYTLGTNPDDPTHTGDTATGTTVRIGSNSGVVSSGAGVNKFKAVAYQSGVTDSPIATSQPYGTPLSRISATGIIGGGSVAWTSPYTKGRYKKYYWKNLQSGPSTYTWGDIDGQLASRDVDHPHFILLLQLNSGDPSQSGNPDHGLPQFVTDAGAVPWPLLNSNHNATTYQYFSWDPVFQFYALQFIAALCDRYDGQISQITMGGLGTSTEMHMPDTFPYPDGETIDQVYTNYVTACNLLIAQYAAHLTRTTFTAALALPFPDNLPGQPTWGTNACNAIVNNALNLYGSAIGFENWGLNALSTNNYLPNNIISTHSPTNPAGFQMAGSTGGGGAPLHGTLDQAMGAGVNLNAQYLQVYGSDIDPPAGDFATITAELKPSPF